jgi:hypothetical protein
MLSDDVQAFSPAFQECKMSTVESHSDGPQYCPVQLDVNFPEEY